MEAPLLVNDFLRRAVKLYGNKEAVVDGDRRFTYEHFADRVHQLAHGLRALGVTKGDRVAVLGPNSHRFLETFYGTAAIGAVIVPINYRLIPADFEYIVQHSGARAFIVDSDYTIGVEPIREGLPGVQHFIVSRHNDTDAPDGWMDYEAVLDGHPTTPPPAPELDESDLLSINYTSGTTARPKGVMITHRNAYINAYNFIAHLRVTHDDVELWTLPMFHANGWGGVYALTAMGAKHVVLRTVDAEQIFHLVSQEGVTFACMAPAVVARIIEFPHKDRYHISTRPRCIVAGAPPPQSHIERLEKDLGWEFIQIYGLTETSPILTVAEVPAGLHQEPARYFAAKARAGHEAIGVDVRVVDDDGDAVPTDDETVGEVVARSNVVLKGYWRQPEATDEVIVDGWFHTGDLATVNAHGAINIVDRAKDVIISGGENISSIEIEDVLYQHPAVLECAVIGIPSEQWGETPLALIVPRDGQQPTEEEIIAFCRDRLAHFKAPTCVELVEALPRTATGKLKKFELRDTYWQGHDRRVH